jgi:hypothetical protein
MTRFFDALGRFSVRFRYPIVLVWLAGTFAVLAVAAGNSPDADQVQAIGVGLALRLSGTDRVPSLPPEPEAERAATPS